MIENYNYHLKAHNNGKKGCTHYGNSKYAVYNCFKLHSYPDWWDSFNEKNSIERGDRKDGDQINEKVYAMSSSSISLPTVGTTLKSTKMGDSDSYNTLSLIR